MGASFEDLIAEAVAVPVAGWDFSWFDGRATEQRPSWGYARLLAGRMAAATAALARVLRPGGIFLSHQIGDGSNRELSEAMLGPLPAPDPRHPERLADAARSAGLTVLDLRAERLRAEFFDVAAVTYFLRKVVWTVPGFEVGEYLPRLRAVHDRIQAEGGFVSFAERVLIEARKPAAAG